MSDCALDLALAVIAGKWKPTILWVLHARPLHFGELRRHLDGISEKVLTEQLRQLEAQGVVEREDYREGAVRRVRYRLTASGQRLNAAVHALAEWGSAHAAAAPAPEAETATAR
jgi:DNA-binding HxlR family transcriptional regulator